jgi:hypothetical protein
MGTPAPISQSSDSTAVSSVLFMGLTTMAVSDGLMSWSEKNFRSPSFSLAHWLRPSGVRTGSRVSCFFRAGAGM